MKFEFKDIQMLEAIEKYGTFAKAAEHLFRTPSAITQNVHKLEDTLGFQIFDRSEYRPKMTKEGKYFLDRGRQILKQMLRLEYDLKLISKEWGTDFAIAYDDLISYEKIFPLIVKFQKVAPNVSIQLYREVLNGCWDALSQNRAVLAIGACGEPPVGLPCEQKVLGTTHFVFAVAPHHPLASLPDPLPNEEILAFPSVVISDTSQFLAARTSGTISGQPVLCVPTMDAKIAAQIQGLGVGYLPRHRIRQFLASGALIERKVQSLKSEVTLKIAWRTDTPSASLDWFLKHLSKTALKEHGFF